MTPTETTDLLTLIALGDKRTFAAADVVHLHGVLGDLRIDECQRAVRVHRMTSVDYLQPAHIRRLVIAERQDIAMRELPTTGGHDLVPMPVWFATTVAEWKARTHAANEHGAKTGEPKRFGDAVITVFDRQTKASPAVRNYWAEEVQ